MAQAVVMRLMMRLIAAALCVLALSIVAGWPFEVTYPQTGRVDSSGLAGTLLGRILSATLLVLGALVIWRVAGKKKDSEIVGRWYW